MSKLTASDSRITLVGLSPDPELREKISALADEIENLAPKRVSIKMFIVCSNNQIEGLIRIRLETRNIEVHSTHPHIHALLEDLKTQCQHYVRAWLSKR